MDEPRPESFDQVEDGLRELRMKAQDVQRFVEDIDVEAYIGDDSEDFRPMRLQSYFRGIDDMTQEASSTVAKMDKVATLPAEHYTDSVFEILKKVLEPLRLLLGVLADKGQRLEQCHDFLEPVLASIRKLEPPMKDLVDGLGSKMDSRDSEIDSLSMDMCKSFDDCIDLYKEALYQLGRGE